MRPRHFAFLRNLALFVSLLSALPATAAEAQQPKRVVVEDFRGPAAGRVRSQLLSNLQRQDDLEVVSRSDVRSTAQELGIRGRSYSEDEYVQIARELNIAAFVDGRTNRRRRRWALTVRVRSGADGMVLGSESWGGRTVGSLNAVRRNGYTRLEPYISAAQSPAPQTNMSTSGVTEVAASGDTPWYAAGAAGGAEDEESVLDLDEDVDEDFDEPIADDARADALQLALVFGSVYRSMAAKACVMSALRGSDPGGAACGTGNVLEDRTYSSGGIGHMEAGIEGVIYPGAFGDAQEVPWFGVVASFRHSLAVSTTGPPPENVDVPTTQSEIYIGARGRYRFTEEGRGPEATVNVGYGNFSFDLDEEALKQLPPNAIIPPVSYRYLLLGAGFSYGLVPTYLRLGLEGSWRLGLGIGDTAKEIWGVETTDMSGFGLAVNAISEAPYITDGVFIGFTFEYFRYSTTYRGQTACVDPAATGDPGTCDNTDPWEPWPHQPSDPDAVTGGITEPVADDYYRLTLKFGYAL